MKRAQYCAAEIVVIGEREASEPLLATARRHSPPWRVVAWAPSAGQAPARPLFEGRRPLDGQPTAWLCRGYRCEEPTTDPERLRAQLA